MSNYDNTGKPMGERIMEAIPGTEQHRATHGVTGTHAGMEGMKSHVPGTEEHRMREAGVVGSGMGTGMDTGMGTGMGGTHTGTGMGGMHTGGATMGEQVMGAIPGTREHEAMYGMSGAHRTVEQAKGYIPGTEEHHIRTGMDPHHHAGMGTMGTTGTGMGTIGTGMGTTGTMGTHDTHHTGMGGTGLGATGLGATGLGATGMGAGHHTGMGTTGTGTGYNEEGKETIGHKVKKMIPGTREHEEKKIEQGRI